MLLSVVLLGLLFNQAATPAQAPVATLLESAKAGDLTAVRSLLSRGAAVDDEPCHDASILRVGSRSSMQAHRVDRWPRAV